MIWTAYYDESGTHNGSPLTVLAGFLAPAVVWSKFETEWKAVLDRHNITHVHAKHLHHREGEHKGWTDGQVEALTADLMPVFTRNSAAISGGFSIIYEDDYREAYRAPGPIWKERLDTSYALCFWSFMHHNPMMLHFQIDPTGKVNFILETGHKNAGDVARVYNDFKLLGRPWSKVAGTLEFATKQAAPALQAADMAAYHAYRSGCANIAENKPIYGFVGRVLKDCGISIAYHAITRQNLGDMRRELEVRSERRRQYGQRRKGPDCMRI